MLQLLVHSFHKRKTKILEEGCVDFTTQKTAIFIATHKEILINGYN